MSKVKTFSYEGITITFEFADGNKMVNATHMARPFPGKKVADFLRLKNSKDYITLLEQRYGNSHIAPKREVLRVIKGGDASEGLQGTWMDEKLALKFAAWLAPAFELWVYDRIQELLTTGKTELREITAMPVVDALRAIADHIEEQQEINEEVKARLAEIEAKITSVDDHYYTIAGYCALHKIPCPLHLAKEWGKRATKLSKEQNVATGTAHDERYGKVRTYHEVILQEVIRPRKKA